MVVVVCWLLAVLVVGTYSQHHPKLGLSYARCQDLPLAADLAQIKFLNIALVVSAKL